MCSLKFRVWSLEQNTYRYKFPYNSLGQFYVSESGKIFSDFGNTVAPEVEQKNFIVEQYTGLKDKNGKEVYENDIVSEHNGDIKGKVVQSITGEWQIAWIGIFGGYSCLYDHTSLCEVIGNVHKNPELLKEKK